MTKSKPHLAIYPDPIIRNGQDVEALCQMKLLSIRIVGFHDVELCRSNWREAFKGACSDCLRIAESLSTERPQDVQFVYAIVPRDSRLGNKLEAQLEESA